MKAILEFDLPEDASEFEDCAKGPKFSAAAWNFDQTLREWLKYGHEFKTPDAALQAARDEFRKRLADNGIDIDKDG